MSFTNAEIIINYFVTRTAVDGLPASDVKGMNASALNLFQCGHIQNISVCINITQWWQFIKCDCIPEMGFIELIWLLILIHTIYM